ncbi:hypothetical protein RQP46_006844 [Phenoliferia psychrophenolica]
MERTPSRPTVPPFPLPWGTGSHRGPSAHVEKCLSGGAHSYVRGSSRSVLPSPSLSLSSALFGSSPTSSDDESVISITPPPSYTTIYPPSPPSSAPSSPQSLAASIDRVFSNPSHKALSSPSPPIKPLLTPQSSSSDVTVAPSLLTVIFPASSPVHALPETTVDLDDVSTAWKGAVLENPAMGTRTLYVSGGSYLDVNLRESVCNILEKAEEELGCTGVVMCLEKNSPDLGDLLHSLMYVGGTITTGPFAPNPAYVLVGLDV